MSKKTTDDHRAIDVRKLHRDGALVPGRMCSWEWKRRGEVIALVGIEVESHERLRLFYKLTVLGKAEVKDYPVSIAWTACHLGGSVNRPGFPGGSNS